MPESVIQPRNNFEFCHGRPPFTEKVSQGPGIAVTDLAMVPPLCELSGFCLHFRRPAFGTRFISPFRFFLSAVNHMKNQSIWIDCCNEFDRLSHCILFEVLQAQKAAADADKSVLRYSPALA